MCQGCVNVTMITRYLMFYGAVCRKRMFKVNASMSMVFAFERGRSLVCNISMNGNKSSF